ncbi:hypothetical protein H072_6625 [Dactylellina haptotyla CBS 200.50]|uniref:tyrosinase n=1 Tax=Dactylellina haptotyla (strain CBS 200.50) TaxID=1284197 RepID=S8AEK3_DACHA|nr:hypothetical protein H072_6625 [Dactylellina haptotyla CBS 200.50]
MAGWSSLKVALVAASIFSAAGVQGSPYGHRDTVNPAVQHGEKVARASNYDPTSLDSNRVPRNVTGNILVTGIQQGFKRGEQPPVRKEIREMLKNRTEFSLFVMALYRLQRQPQELDNSYYALAGIHGQPYKAWDKVETVEGASKTEGYCAHGDMLFLPWHRPYIAVFEQQVWNHAYDIVMELPKNHPKRAKFMKVLPTLRLPYWDWASNSDIPSEIAEENMIPIETIREDEEKIQNPLYSYWFTSTNEFKNYLWGDLKETIRFPTADKKISTQSRGLLAAMKARETTWKDKVYKILMSSKTFVSMAKGSVDSEDGDETEYTDSLEDVHGDVHVSIGNSWDEKGNFVGVGTMTPPNFSGFDPIFWLHHANVDRLFAMWQNLHPKGYTFSETTKFPTYVRPVGEKVDLDTPLKPFRQTMDGKFWTSASVGDTKKFGYIYPETRGSDKQTRVEINKLYGLTTRRIKNAQNGVDSAVGGSKLTKRGADTKPNLTPVKDKIIHEGDKYIDWTANIKVNKAALNGSFAVYVFLGEPVNNTVSAWATDKNFVGTSSIFANSRAKNMMVSGTVPLTSALMGKVANKLIKDNSPASIIPYLMKNLKIKAAVPQVDQLPELKDVKDLKIQIVAQEVKLPSSEDEAPSYGKPERQLTFIDVAAGLLEPKIDISANSTIKKSY